MDNFQGDLTDIIRATGASYGSSCSTDTSSSEAAPFSHDDDLHWQFSSVLEDPRGNFGDPFSNTRDPFLHELDMLGSACFNSPSSAEISSSKGLEEAGCFGGGVIIDNSNSSVLAQEILEDDHMRRPCNCILLNMTHFSTNATLAMSPCDSPVIAASPSAVVSSNMINANTSKEHYSMDNTGIVQISSPRNPGLKRRKCQAKKYICIPAPTAPNSRQSGEIVPCDLWAWRKYGQKPIKGSPYPRSYYRCSSLKGCPARKQVERSRTDPNMLVITYTSEHNHAWPTQRNALGRSTRYQQLPSKNNINANSKNSVTTDQPQNGTTKKQQEEQQEISNSDINVSPAVAAGNSSSLESASLKEEINGIEKQKLEIDDGEFSNGLTYKASKLKCNQLEDFFAKLREVEADSLNLLYPKCFNAVVDDRESKGVESVDPFHLFDRS